MSGLWLPVAVLVGTVPIGEVAGQAQPGEDVDQETGQAQGGGQVRAAQPVNLGISSVKC